MDSCRGSIQLKRSQRLFQKLITEAATGLSFSPDTLEDLTPGKTSYNQADFQQLFKPSGVLKPRKTKERNLCRPAPRPPGRFTGLLPLEKSEDQALPQQQTVYILQESQSRTRPTAAKKDKPAHMATHRNQDQNFLNQMVKYQKNLQRLSGSEKMATHPNKSLKTDLSVPEDRNSTAVSRPPTDAAGADGWLAAQCSAHGGDQHHRVIQRLIAQLCEADQQEDPDPPFDAQLVVPLLSFLSSQTVRHTEFKSHQCVYLLSEKPGYNLRPRAQ